ncbi:MAG: hypothetical protein ACLTYW_05780 [Collinsella sp.]
MLVADFDDDEDARWFAVMLLGSKQAFMHEWVAKRARCVTTSRATTPFCRTPRKGAELCIVRASTMEIGYVDKKRKIAGEDRMLIPTACCNATRVFRVRRSSTR